MINTITFHSSITPYQTANWLSVQTTLYTLPYPQTEIRKKAWADLFALFEEIDQQKPEIIMTDEWLSDMRASADARLESLYDFDQRD